MTQPTANAPGALGAPGSQVQSAQGEDRSDYQAVGPWTGDSFGFAKATEGLGWIGQTFAANWAALKAAGIRRGAYHFFHPELNAVAQAHFFLSVVQANGLEPGDMLVVDSETFPGSGGVLTSGSPGSGMGPDLAFATTLDSSVSVGSATRTFLETLHNVAHPHNPRIVYTYLDALQYLGDCHKYQLWIAHPGSIAPTNAQVAPWETWQFWQWGSEGAGGGLQDAFNGTVPALHAWIDGYLNPGAVLQSDQTAP